MLVWFGLVPPNYDTGSFTYSTPIYSNLFCARSCIRPEGMQSEWKCLCPHDVEMAGQDGRWTKKKMVLSFAGKCHGEEESSEGQVGSRGWVLLLHVHSRKAFLIRWHWSSLGTFFILDVWLWDTVNLRRPGSCQERRMKQALWRCVEFGFHPSFALSHPSCPKIFTNELTSLLWF